MLFVNIGSMGASKTTNAVEKAVRLSVLGRKVVYVNSSRDTRVLEGGVEGIFTSHNSSLRFLSDKVATVSCTKLSIGNYDAYDEVIIDEAQFFDDLVEVVLDILDRGKNVSVFSLSGDSSRNLFGRVHELIPRADKIKHLRAICTVCAAEGKMTRAPFTYSTPQTGIVVGGMDKYKPVCGSCWRDLSHSLAEQR